MPADQPGNQSRGVTVSRDVAAIARSSQVTMKIHLKEYQKNENGARQEDKYVLYYLLSADIVHW